MTTLDGTSLTACIKALAASGHPGRGHQLLVGVIAASRSSRRGEAGGDDRSDAGSGRLTERS
jgi:hypothetical protein